MAWGNTGWLDGENGDGGWYKNKASGGALVPTRIQSALKEQGGGQSNTTTATLPANVGSGNMVYVVVAYGTGSGFSSISDDASGGSNTYTAANAVVTSAGWNMQSFYVSNVTNAPKNITANFTASPAFQAIFAVEFSNVLGASPLDAHTGQGQTNPGTGANAVTSGAATTTAAGELIIGAVVNSSTISTYTAGTGFTKDPNSDTVYAIEYLVQGSAGSIAATFTDSAGASAAYITLMSSFKHA